MKGLHSDSISIVDIAGDPLNFTYNEICGAIGENNAKLLYSFLYKSETNKNARSIWIKEVIENTEAKKYIFELRDQRYIETVSIGRRTGVTACVSTQVGCPVQCVFCQSGRCGFIRNLSTSEIVGQVIYLKERVNRIAFMGIGEPLFNYDALIKAIHILRDRNGLDFPTDGITISTVGAVKQLKKIREEHIKIQLVLSLHATTQQVRDRIIPAMRGNDINETVKAALSYSKRHNRKLVVAYLLLDGINDSTSDVKKLVEWFKGENVMINLLEYNQTTGSLVKAANKGRLERFKNGLSACGIETIIRASRGRNIKAACGQLAARYNANAKRNRLPFSGYD
ncbi:MAG: radical SAM protein [Helicobacteraceae bacterium]|jgi:23S rRNA (adenine2503-C2)-methyltransferase|nr:radical SAM protein [Helicobacteraceae bacterium]